VSAENVVNLSGNLLRSVWPYLSYDFYQESKGILSELLSTSSIVCLSLVHLSSSRVWSTRFGFMSLGSLTVL